MSEVNVTASGNEIGNFTPGALGKECFHEVH